jgi:two-component system, OmpR family, sensor histidine kinase KdpD
MSPPSPAGSPRSLRPTVEGAPSRAGTDKVPEEVEDARMEQQASRSTPGDLRVFLGTAVGVGKTYAMLEEGWRRSRAGDDVAIGYLERHGRPQTRAQAQDLERIPPRRITYHGATFEDLDVDGVIARHPDVVLVDELAHSRITDGRPRSMDVEDIRLAGIDVVTTLNVANLESMREFAAEVTGAGSVESVPDGALRQAQVELVDLPPDLLRRRVADGYVYSPERVDSALANYFRSENLAALGELARSWLAGTGENEGPDIVARHTTTGPSDVVIAGVSGRDGSVAVVKRAAQLAEAADAELVVIHVVDAVGHSRWSDCIDELRDLAASLGGTYNDIRSEDPVDGLTIAATEFGASTVVIGRHRSWMVRFLRGAVARRLRARLPGVTVETVDSD